MAKSDTFFLRTTLTSSGTNYVSDEIDVSAFTNPSVGKVLVIDNCYITYSTDGQGPIVAADVVASGTGGKQMGAQACSEVQTSLVEMKTNALFARSNIYAAVNPAGALSTVNMTDSLNPTRFKNGFTIPTDSIHCGIATGSSWNGELDVGFLFEVHTEKLSLKSIQELLISLTAN